MTDENRTPRPGEAALNNMKLLKHESGIFKVPKAPTTKVGTKKSKVLDEDVYVEGISKIIQRDFFPDLEKLNAQNDFLEATENKDYARLREIARKYSGNRPPTDPCNTPATFDTPGPNRPFTPSMNDESSSEILQQNRSREKQKDITDNHSLDSFLSSHTSEDNASYDKVIALEDRKRASKLTDQFEAEVTSRALAEDAVRLPSIEEQADQTDRPHELATWKYTAKNYIMYVPSGGSSQGPPAKPELRHHNTRLKADPFDHQKSKEVISAIAKNQGCGVSGAVSVDGCQPPSPSPRRLVPPASPCPGGRGESPLMTWGDIEGTPFRLDGGDTPLPAVGSGAAYRMLEGGVRERLGLQLAEQVARRRRPATPAPAPSTPSFRTNTERLASMSPAARRLAAKHLLTPRHKLTPHNMGIHMNTPKRTPTPQRRIVTTPNVKPRPSTAGQVNNSQNMTENNNITDNLLQINLSKRERLKAKDFFQ